MKIFVLLILMIIPSGYSYLKNSVDDLLSFEASRRNQVLCFTLETSRCQSNKLLYDPTIYFIGFVFDTTLRDCENSFCINYQDAESLAVLLSKKFLVLKDILPTNATGVFIRSIFSRECSISFLYDNEVPYTVKLSWVLDFSYENNTSGSNPFVKMRLSLFRFKRVASFLEKFLSKELSVSDISCVKKKIAEASCSIPAKDFVQSFQQGAPTFFSTELQYDLCLAHLKNLLYSSLFSFL